ncbi:MAG: hypoxanthine phosphoribosyltransferase [Candidatus Zixiibacteriota bacterium]
MKLLDNQNLELKPFELLLDQRTISHRISELGMEITAAYKNKNPVLLGVLKGCVVFLSDLIRKIKLPLELEFVSAASYRKGSKPEDNIILGGAVAIPLKGRHVLIVEGVVDSGKTVSAIIKQVNKKEPASVEIVTLVDKPASHRSKLHIKYKGFSIGNEFVIGFGLDNTQKYRNLPFIGKLIDVV